MVLPRQYRKNIGRKLKVSTGEHNFEGNLTDVPSESITLEWKSKGSQTHWKGKITVQKKQEIAFSEIEEAKVVLKF